MISNDVLVAHFSEHEGRVPHFYLDTVGLVTIGIGCQLFRPFKPETAGEWVEAISGVPAHREAVILDYTTVYAAGKGMVASSYAPMCKTRLTEASIDKLFFKRIQQISDLLRDDFPFGEMPDGARFVLMDMCFNLGLGNLKMKFPRFCAAMIDGDYHVAAAESARKGDAWEKRNQWAFDTLTAL